MIPFMNDKFQSKESWDRYQRLQEGIVGKVMGSDKKMIAICAPPGIGKSLIGMMVGYHSDMKVRTNYLCTTKALQHQVKDDFPEAHVMMGRNNYPCGLYTSFKADTCVDKCDDYKDGKVACEYYDEKIKMFKAKYRVLNTTYFLCEANYTKALSKQKLIIIDEADKLDDELCGFIGVSVSMGDIKKYRLDSPRYITKMDSWIDWACDCSVKIGNMYPLPSTSYGLDKNYIKALKLKDKFNFLIGNLQESDGNWIFNKHARYWEFKPVWLDEKMADKYLWSHSGKFVLMSATLPSKPVMCWMLKIDPDKVDYIEVDHPYPVKNRMVYYRPRLDMTWKNKDNWWQAKDEVEKVLKEHPNDKGIIHTTSYAIRDVIMECYNDRLITHDDSKDKIKKLKEFKESDKPLVFVSPSIERGVSLDGDMSRFSVWVKVPWKNLGDKRVQQRVYGSKIGNDWYGSDAAMSIVQGAGRPVRSEDDWAKCYVLDKQFGKVIRYLPEWFRDSIVVEG